MKAGLDREAVLPWRLSKSLIPSLRRLGSDLLDPSFDLDNDGLEYIGVPDHTTAPGGFHQGTVAVADAFEILLVLVLGIGVEQGGHDDPFSPGIPDEGQPGPTGSGTNRLKDWRWRPSVFPIQGAATPSRWSGE